MSKNNKSSLKGLEALGTVLEAPEESAVAAALEALASEPAFLNYLQAQEKVEKAAHLKAEADRIAAEIEERKGKLGDTVLKQQSLQNRMGAFMIQLREGLLKASGITQARADWGDNFKSMLERAVDVGVSRSTNYANMQAELGKLMAEAEEIRNANGEAAYRVIANREKYDALTKEAGELLASIEGGA